ncbi:AraC family transcriptional regulator [Lactobacillus sp. CBA3606]|uniref:bifunctional transcriptional activator/DNA repair enzyme AdaA n=1 Tax=Lactobacillus sp. CBA3606 TaxID=2099789 RepID=UPI000CFCA086|nr:Ada metal-binding domain-containing protein [Lactobacillus sp. CBA3606]AVK63666.1 AraC family transcriptional regulator [Lactobacillus sp. CBA3606]
MLRLTAARWQAIQTNDVTKDGDFYYGVTSTGIFCRPSCPSRLPKREHVQVFKTTAAASQAGFRPCKRCRPTGRVVSAADWVITINRIMAHHYAEPLTLTELAKRAHGAPDYLHHVYRQQTGQTPLAYLQQIRLQQARRLLMTSPLPISAVAQACGFQSAAYFSTTFKKAFQQTPRQFRLQTKTGPQPKL